MVTFDPATLGRERDPYEQRLPSPRGRAKSVPGERVLGGHRHEAAHEALRERRASGPDRGTPSRVSRGAARDDVPSHQLLDPPDHPR